MNKHPIIVENEGHLHEILHAARVQGKKIGFAPTMGALHAGHLSLLEHLHEMGVFSVASIFVNPTQFNDSQDFDTYPKDLERDISLLTSAGTQVIFIPSQSVIYPNGNMNPRQYALGHLEKILEGHHRPGHFQGVAQVVHRLLDLVEPDVLVLGQKDYQQVMIIRNLVNTILRRDLVIEVAPTMRESDGLAMSSRNVRLTASERLSATHIYKSLRHIREHWQMKSDAIWSQWFREEMKGLPGVVKVEYAEARDAATLLPPFEGQNVVFLTAVQMTSTRLIDNIEIP